MRGVETYFLNFATNPDAEAVAARENAASVQTMGTLPGDPQGDRAQQQARGVARVRDAAADVARCAACEPRPVPTQDLGVKQAPFVVLIGAQMPSVLAEISFLTNKAEAALLKQPAYRQLIAQALLDAILKYQTSLKRVSAPASER